MSRLPLHGSDYQREQAAAWAAQERRYNLCDCENASCEACILDRVIAEEEGALERGVVRAVPEGAPWPRPAA